MANRGNSEYNRLDVGQPEYVFFQKQLWCYDTWAAILRHVQDKGPVRSYKMKSGKFINLYCLFFFSWYNYSTWDDYHLAFSTSWTSCKIFVVLMLTCYQIHELSNIMLWICELFPVSKKFNGEFYKSISASRWNGCFDRAKLGLCRSGDIFSACFPHRYRFVCIFIWLIITLNCKSIRGKREALKRNLEITHYI